MSESPNKKIKCIDKLTEDLTVELPEHLVEYIISTYLPIQYVLQNRVVIRNQPICSDSQSYWCRG
ncbi:BnaCnng74530D [Brassica napus]|uniref:BnaCnng74530D protein n=2 Tax=Brassica TaxID=3705 RepID=A0A078K219_BRANA|nr:BnaCnng74530D [Brassica napus]VDD61396.1 unnamed protein product [Brassica oleracea]